MNRHEIIIPDETPPTLAKTRWQAVIKSKGRRSLTFSFGGYAAIINKTCDYTSSHPGFDWGVWRAGKCYSKGHENTESDAKCEAKKALLEVIDNPPTEPLTTTEGMKR